MKKTLYIYNNGRNVSVEIGDIHVEYVGPYSLVKFVKVNKCDSGVIYVDTEFHVKNETWIEEDYIDLESLFDGAGYNAVKIIDSIKEVQIKQNVKPDQQLNLTE